MSSPTAVRVQQTWLIRAMEACQSRPEPPETTKPRGRAPTRRVSCKARAVPVDPLRAYHLGHPASATRSASALPGS